MLNLGAILKDAIARNIKADPHQYRTAMVTADGPVFRHGTVVSVRVWGIAGDKFLFSCKLGEVETVLREDFLADFRCAPYTPTNTEGDAND